MFFYFPKLKIYFEDMKEIERKTKVQIHIMLEEEFQKCFILRKTLWNKYVESQRPYLKKVNISFIVDFCLGKYSSSVDTFWKYLVF